VTYGRDCRGVWLRDQADNCCWRFAVLACHNTGFAGQGVWHRSVLLMTA